MRLIICFLLLIFSTLSYAQGEIYDDFSEKSLPGWIWGGIDLKYSHETDNKENGYAIISSKSTIKSGSYLGKIVKTLPVIFVPGNYINLMLQGVSNDINVVFSVIYDIDHNNKIEEDKDILLVSKPFSLDFDGWKQVKLKLDAQNFTIKSKSYDDFTLTEQEAYGIQLEFETGQNFKGTKFESGIALISQIQSKENLTSDFFEDEKESYFNAKNQPNPFNPHTIIHYTLPQESNVNITVYDRIGRTVRVLIDTFQSAGTYSVDFDGTDLPSGIYFYRIKTAYNTEVRKMFLSK